MSWLFACSIFESFKFFEIECFRKKVIGDRKKNNIKINKIKNKCK
jgi:hypothetical protein